MDDKREIDRIAFRTTIKYGLNNPPEHTAFVTDLSDSGICIKTNKVFKPGTKLYLIIHTADKSYKAEGVVSWAKKAPLSLERFVKNGMGIRFASVDQEFIDHYHKKRVDKD